VTRQRSAIAEELRQASKVNGPDPQMNPRLADIVTKAKKIGFPKASIESAIARGQGVSSGGIALENLSIEAMIPPSVSVIVECQTDSKLRTLSDLRLAVKEAKGTMTPTNHMFERKGRIVFEKTRDVNEAEIFDQTIEAGAIDVEIVGEGDVVVLTDPSETTAVASTLAQNLGFKVKSSDIIWDPKQEMKVDVPSSENLESFLGNGSHPSNSSTMLTS